MEFHDRLGARRKIQQELSAYKQKLNVHGPASHLPFARLRALQASTSSLLLKRHEELYENGDCNTEGFVGVRAQDILPLLLARFNARGSWRLAVLTPAGRHPGGGGRRTGRGEGSPNPYSRSSGASRVSGPLARRSP